MNESAPKNRTNSCLVTGAITALVLILLSILALFGGCYMCNEAMVHLGDADTGKLKKLNKAILREGSSHNQIAVIYLDFVIGANIRKTENILTELNRASTDDSVKAIVLYVNSPGGAVTASDVIYNGVRQARKTKPVVVYMDDMAASGGYYVSCAAQHIVANPNTLTGSIGVIISTINLSSAMEKIGVSAEVYTSGDFKDMLSPTRPVRDDEKAYIQSLIQETYDGFLDIVSKGRSISIADLQARNAVDGRVISGRKALEIGLVDENGYLENALAKAEELGGINEGTSLVFRYKKNDLEDLLSTFFTEAAAENKVKVELSPNPLPQLQPGIPYLLPRAYVSGNSTK